MAMIETNPAVTHIQQPSSKLCWATSILMMRQVIKGWNPDITPDRIVQRSMMAASGTNKTAPDFLIIGAMYDWLGAGKWVKRQLTLAEIKNNIDANLPFMIGINWNAGGAHAIVCGGYDAKGPDWGLLKLFDPLAPSSATVSTDRMIGGKYDPDYKIGTENAGGTDRTAGAWTDSFIIA
ncbi:papain-like cysteine protease family protein [Sandarakinorhabdus oryzae]|uniref:papain-like cysteine protease family protein n=1 Tax=Sandarakinorhabdus oryzae TaxID=2675220 RepID=UPI0012E32449|nr:papain-like cysteine protease family protein [Sandarakinorhabdus oryzae]